jgi:hypothetical protein
MIPTRTYSTLLLTWFVVLAGCNTIVDPGSHQSPNGTFTFISGTIINWQGADSITVRAENYVGPSNTYVFDSSTVEHNGTFAVSLSVPPAAALIKLTAIDSGATTLSISDTSARVCTLNLALYRPNNTSYGAIRNKYQHTSDSASIGDFNCSYCYSDRDVVHIATTQLVNALGDTVKLSFTFQFKQGWNRLKTTLAVKKPHLQLYEGKVDNIPDGYFDTY